MHGRAGSQAVGIPVAYSIQNPGNAGKRDRNSQRGSCGEPQDNNVPERERNYRFIRAGLAPWHIGTATVRPARSTHEGDAEKLFRLQPVPSHAGECHPPYTGRQGLSGAHAHRRRQEHLLPDTGSHDGGNRHRGVAAHLSDEGPSGVLEGQRHQCSSPQQQCIRSRKQADERACQTGRIPLAVCVTRAIALRDGIWHPPPRCRRAFRGADEGKPLCHRRGSLHLAVGSRLQARIHPAETIAFPLPPGAHCSLHGNSRQADQRRHHRATSPEQECTRRSPGVRFLLRPSQPLTGCAARIYGQGQDEPHAEAHQPPRWRERHHLLHEPEDQRECGGETA